MNTFSLNKALLLGFAILLLQGCGLPVMMADATTKSPKAEHVIVVGKFEVSPPLADFSGNATDKSVTYGRGRYFNQVFFSATHNPVDSLDYSMRSRQWKNTLNAFWGQTYLKETKAQKTYLNAGMLYLDSTSMDRAWLPGGFSFTPPANAKAVYIGTVRYTRDDFWNITQVHIIDEYKEARTEFEEYFGKSIHLEKALLR